MSAKEKLLNLAFKEPQPLSKTELLEILPQGFTRRRKSGGIWENITAEHGPGHSLFLIGLIHRYAPICIARTGISLNMDGLDAVAIFHDSERKNDGLDPNHAGLAAKNLEQYLQSSGRFIPSEISVLIKVCSIHNYDLSEMEKYLRTIEKKPDAKKFEAHLRFFMFCDVLSQVRYEQNGHRVTAEMLNSILPNVFQTDELNSIISFAKMWNRFYEKRLSFKTKTNRLAQPQIDALLETGLHPMIATFTS